jgi:hypothetical protein
LGTFAYPLLSLQISAVLLKSTAFVVQRAVWAHHKTTSASYREHPFAYAFHFWYLLAFMLANKALLALEAVAENNSVAMNVALINNLNISLNQLTHHFIMP